MARLKSPFPYYGGKSRIADEVWEHFGIVERYIEPFAGSLAVLLANPNPANMEIVCDTNGFICNFWRSVKTDPEQTAYYADYPSIHQDLTARHKWLKLWGMDKSARLCNDPYWYDCKAAGWWVWGMSLWIGGEWCDLNQKGNIESRPFVQKNGSGQGVNNIAGRPYVPNKGNSGRGVNAGDKQISVSIKSGGKGVSVQTYDKRPEIKDSGGGRGCKYPT